MWSLNDSVVLISVDLDGQFFRLGIQGPILEFSVFNSSDHQFLNLVFFWGGVWILMYGLLDCQFLDLVICAFSKFGF